MSRHARRALGLRMAVDQQREGPPLLRALRDNGLSLAFWALFALLLAGLVFAEQTVYNDERARLGEAPFDLAQLLGSARLWFDLFQTWQAEFFAMGTFLVLSIILREEDSAESKPIGASDAQTGGANE